MIQGVAIFYRVSKYKTSYLSRKWAKAYGYKSEGEREELLSNLVNFFFLIVLLSHMFTKFGIKCSQSESSCSWHIGSSSASESTFGAPNFYSYNNQGGHPGSLLQEKPYYFSRLSFHRPGLHCSIRICCYLYIICPKLINKYFINK